MKKRIPGLFFLACLCVPIFLAGQANLDDKQGLELLRKLRLTQPLLNKASDLLTAKDWDGAVQQFKRCLEVQPECPDACFGMAYVCNQTGDIPGALKWIEQAENGSLTLQKAWEDQKTSMFKSSQEERMRLFELAEDLLNNGMYTYSCKSQKILAESTQATEKAQKISADSEAGDSPFAIPAEYYSLHGNLLFKLKRLPEAEAQYLLALAIAPAHERCLNNLINIYFVTGRIGQARGWLEKADRLKVRINPGLAQAVRQAKPDHDPGNPPR